MRLERRRLVIDADLAETVRARVGLVGWVVLEVIAGHTPPGRGVVEVRCSARSLAPGVGVSKDSVARALRSLAEAGIVERVDRRDERSGRFVATSYRVDLAAAGITVAAVSLSTTPAPAAAPSPTDRRPPCDHLSLIG